MKNSFVEFSKGKSETENVPSKRRPERKANSLTANRLAERARSETEGDSTVVVGAVVRSYDRTTSLVCTH